MKLNKTPQYSFGLKTNISKPNNTPAPGAYNTEKAFNSPQYSFGLKTNIEKPNGVPGLFLYTFDIQLNIDKFINN